MIPELRAAPDAMLEPHRFFFGHPGISIVVYFVEHLAIVCGDFRHILPLFTAAVSTARAVYRMHARWKAAQTSIKQNIRETVNSLPLEKKARDSGPEGGSEDLILD